jgi:hypothetical protein
MAEDIKAQGSSAEELLFEIDAEAAIVHSERGRHNGKQ